jgi:hypothetical protein
LVWERRLLKFVDVFTKRRDSFMFTMNLYTAVNVGAIAQGMEVVDKRTAEMSQR